MKPGLFIGLLLAGLVGILWLIVFPPNIRPDRPPVREPKPVQTASGEELLWQEVEIMLERPCAAKLRFVRAANGVWHLAPVGGAGLPVAFLFPQDYLVIIDAAKAARDIEPPGTRIYLSDALTLLGEC